MEKIRLRLRELSLKSRIRLLKSIEKVLIGKDAQMTNGETITLDTSELAKNLPLIAESELLVSPDFEITITQEQIKSVLSAGYPDYPTDRTVMSEDEYKQWVEQGRPADKLDKGVYNHPNYINGKERNMAVVDDGSQDFSNDSFPDTFDERPVERDSRGRPLHPYTQEMLMAGVALDGPGFYWNYGPNRAADPVVFREQRVEGQKHNKLQVLLIKRKDTGSIALPGGMVDKEEPSISTATRELLEEAGTDLSHVEHKTVHQGVVVDPRMTLYSWPETTVELLLPDKNTADGMKLKAGDDAREALWVDVTEENLSQLFASHADFLKVSIKAWQEETNKVVRVDGVVGKLAS